MRERPILFSAPMVRALLSGTKTQTRRTVKLPHMNPLGQWEPFLFGGPNGGRTAGGETIPARLTLSHSRTGEIIGCPLAQPGDRLWVRENGWERPERSPRMMREGADTWAPYYYDADSISDAEAADFKAWGFKRRPSIHMPRKACRIHLEVTGVRVERLQTISEADARAEGIVQFRDGHGWHTEDGRHYMGKPQRSYASLWESINGAGSWDANPWVWVIEFRRATP